MIRQLNELFKIDKCKTIPWQIDHSTTLLRHFQKRDHLERTYLHCMGFAILGDEVHNVHKRPEVIYTE